MQIVVVGANHNSSPVEFRERLWVAPDALADVARELRARVAEAFVLSTCNRFELYAVCGHEASGAELLREFLATRSGISACAVHAATYAHAHRAAVSHALRVAAGLDSVALGETEVLGQVRRAVSTARRAGTLGAVLDRLAAAVLVCGKRVRSTTALGARRPSVASIGVRAAVRTHGSLRGATVVVVGAGETAQRALAELACHEAGRLIVVNRTWETGYALARAHRAEARPWASLEHTMSQADVVIACTSAPAFVISAEALRCARTACSGRRLLCVDLGMPRNIEPAIATLPDITLLDIEAAGACLGVEPANFDAGGVQSAENVVAEEVERFMEWWRARDVAPTIARLHARVGALGEAELARALSRLPDLSPRERAVVSQLATRIVGKVLRNPTMVLKHDPEGANMAVVLERLFALDRSDASRVTAPGSAERGDSNLVTAPHVVRDSAPVAT